MGDISKYSGPSDGFDDTDAGQQSSRVILGTKLAFSNDGEWLDASEEIVPPTLELAVVSMARVLQKWTADNMPVKGCTKFLTSGERPDVDAMNEACPRSEWGKDFNDNPRGPWRVQNITYFVNMETMERYTYPTNTTGGNICIDDLKGAVKMMRQFRGPNVFPVVSVGTKPMKTRFATRPRPRPHFVIKRWITFGPEGAALPSTSAPSLPPPSQPDPDKIAASADQAKAPDEARTKAAKVKTKAKDAGAREVQEPSLHEELDDDIPF